mgnify:CR=1 FL=1
MEENKEMKMPVPGSLIISSSPHLHDGATISGIMLQVLLCLLPAVVAAIWFFGLHALRVMALCVAFSMVFEFLWCKLMKTPNTTRDLSAAVTGLILALNLPSQAQWWLCMTGAFVAIIIAKEVFGGLGQNIFNPAIAGRVFLLVSFPAYMTNWQMPGGLFGVGLGNSYQKHMWLPEPQNDFIFAILCEELGFIGAIALIALFVLFTWRGFVIAKRAPDTFSSVLVAGLTAKVGIQAMLNIAVVTASIPATGIALPFFSYGGTALVMQLAEMGIILSVSRYSSQSRV